MFIRELRVHCHLQPRCVACEARQGGTFEREPIQVAGQEENFPVFYRPDQEDIGNVEGDYDGIL